jgi:hypothetical protein
MAGDSVLAQNAVQRAVQPGDPATHVGGIKLKGRTLSSQTGKVVVIRGFLAVPKGMARGELLPLYRRNAVAAKRPR